MCIRDSVRVVVEQHHVLDGIGEFPVLREVEPCQIVIDAEDLLLQDARVLAVALQDPCLLYTSPSPRDRTRSRMPSSD